MNTRLLPAHGTYSRHRYHGCACKTCHSSYRAYERRRYRLRGYGTWQPLVDVQPVRDHLTPLVAAGFTVGNIAAAAALPASVLHNVLYGSHTKVRVETADRLRAVQPGQLRVSPHSRIDATGTRRRLQALVAIGWPLAHTARRAGLFPRHLPDVLRAETVTRRTASVIRVAYRQMCLQDPASGGVPRCQVTAARRLAAARGWPGPLAWDDIDDPAARPDTDTLDCRTAGRGAAADRAADIRHLARFGYATGEIASRVGVTEDYVRTQLRGQRLPGQPRTRKETT